MLKSHTSVTRSVPGTPSSPTAITPLVTLDAPAPLSSFDDLYRTPTLDIAAKEAHIRALRDQLSSLELDADQYLGDLERDVGADRVTLVALSFAELEEQERLLQKERLADSVAVAETERRRREHILKLELLSRDAVAERASVNRAVVERVSRQNREALRQYMRAVQHEFTISETKLRGHIRDAGGHLITEADTVRTLADADVPAAPTDDGDGEAGELAALKRLHSLVFTAVKQRRWRIEWEHTPQPLRMHILLVRALKDKGPRGEYVMRVSIYDKLGGQPYRWGSTYRACATKPVRHAGRHYSVDLWFEQNLFTSTPAPADLRPSMVFVFQLYRLASQDCHVDTVVGWGALPVCNSRFEVVEGKFRVPLLRGDIDPYVSRYERFEQLYKSDLDNWLCNMYFEISHLSRYHNGQREYSVDLQYKPSFKEMLPPTIGERSATTELDQPPPIHHRSVNRGPGEGSAPLPGPSSSKPMTALGGTRVPAVTSPAAAAGTTSTAAATGTTAAGTGPSFGAVALGVHALGIGAAAAAHPHPSPRRNVTIQSTPIELGPSQDDAAGDESATRKQVPLLTLGGRLFPRGGVTDSAALEAGVSDGVMIASPRAPVSPADQARIIERDLILSEPGVSAVVHGSHNTDPGPGVDAKHHELRSKVLANPDALSVYHFTVVASEKRRSDVMDSKIETEAQRKLKYIRDEMVKELHPRQWRHVGYWLTILMLLVVFYLRQFVHVVGQSLFIQLMRVPVRDFTLYGWGGIFQYRADLLPVTYEIGMIVVGCVANIVVMCLLVAVSALSQTLLGIFPDFGSRFLFCWGLGTVLDPLIQFFVDAVTLQWTYGDAFRLYRYFDTNESNGVVGIILTIFIDALLMMIGSMILYLYLYQLHMNGRLLDVYHRLHGGEGRFVLPRDMEVSVRELKRTLDETRRWRGVGGGSRRIVVLYYALQGSDPLVVLDPSQPPEGTSDYIAHIAILNVGLNGAAELHRHFLRFADGSFVEVFGNLETLTYAQQQLLRAHLAANGMTVYDFLHVYKAKALTRSNVLSYAMALRSVGMHAAADAAMLDADAEAAAAAAAGDVETGDGAGVGEYNKNTAMAIAAGAVMVGKSEYASSAPGGGKVGAEAI